MTESEIINHIMTTPKLAGQISSRRLKTKFIEIGQQYDGELLSVVILVKRPKQSEIAKVVPVFGRTKLKSIEIIPVSKLASVMSISHLVRFYYFIKKQ